MKAIGVAITPYSRIKETPRQGIAGRALALAGVVVAAGSCSGDSTVEPANQRPTVELTAPSLGGTAPVNSPITVSAVATDVDGAVQRVEFFDGATSIGSDETSPYSFQWTPTTPGPRTLTARATDERNATTISAGRSFGVISPLGEAVFVGAGDIARCNSDRDEATAALLDAIPGTVFTLGDNAYENGTAAEFASCYEPSWGRHKSRTKPVAGNHDYNTPDAAAYFDYFGAAAGPRGKGYYSFELGGWHIIVLNSNIDRTATSEQVAWLRADLSATAAQCTMALWHHPRFSSGPAGNGATQQPFWDALYQFGAEVVLVGHDHAYERFARQTPVGVADPARGIRQFVVGTGGTGLHAFATIRENSEFRDNTTWGVMKLDLVPTGYAWSYITAPSGAVIDSGTGTCH